MMIGAGQWLLLSADVPQVAANTWASAGGFGAMPDGTAAASLADGRIVVAGGQNSDGTLVSQVGIFDPASQSWEDGGQLAVARTGHTVTALHDGRVLIAGGRTENGPSFDVEIYNPNTRQSVHAGDMWVPRVNHAAAELGNGQVLIVGGSNGSGFLDYVELFDSATGQTESQAVRLTVARDRLTATRLLDGHVLIAGGRNESGSLAIAEIFVSGSRSIFETGSLRTPRSGHAAVLLPNNNQVLIAGGAGAAALSAELYADWRDGFTAVPNPMSQARTGAVAGALPYHNLAFVGGGGSTSGEYFGYATVKTDRADYWPGETVTITGSGWQPGETVTLKISEDADTHNDFTYTAVADAQGDIINAQFAPIEDEVFHHFGMRFYLTATGAASTALNTFSDGNSTISGTVRSSATNAPIANATVSCTGGCDAPASETTDAAGFYSFKVPFPGNGTATITLSASATGYVAQTLPSFQTAHQQIVSNKDFLLDPSVRTTSTSVVCAPNSIAVNASSTCTATVSDTGTGTPTAPTGSVTFSTNGGGTFDFASCNLSGSPAACAVVYTATARGTGTHAITGSYTPTSSHTSSSNAAAPFALTVVKAAQATLNLTTPASLVYGTLANASVTGGSGSGAVTFSAGSSNGCSIDSASGAITVTNASGTCAISAEKAADNDYLVATAGPNTVTLEKADATVSVNGYSGTYDAQPHGATGTATGVGGANLNSQLDLGATFTNFPGGTANWTFNGGNNYVTESGSVEIEISKADALVSVTGYSGTYDAAAHGASGTATGVGGVNLFAQLNLGASFTDAPGGTANWSFNGGTNYLDESGSVQIVINKADANVSVSGFTGTYDGNAHGATGTATGVGGITLPGLNLGDSFTNVPGGTAHWTFDGGTNYLNESGDVQIVIDKADANVSVSGFTGTFDGNAHGATGTATGVGGVTLPGLNLGDSFTDVPGGTAHWTFDGGTNYLDESGDVQIVINKATANVSVNGYTGTYDGNAHGATGTATGIGGVALPGLNLGDSFTNVPGGTANWTFDGGTNYEDQYGSVEIVINKADATVTVTGYTGTYDAQAHGATGSATGLGDVPLAGLNLGDSFTDAPGGTAHWTFEGGTNYEDESGDVQIVINKADATVVVNGYSGTYDGNPHGASGTAKGVGGVDLPGLNLGASFTNVPGGTANWTFDGGTNYNNQHGTASIEIAPKAASVKADDKAKTYGDPNPALTATVEDAVSGDTLNYSLSTAAGQFTGIGSYPITVNLGSNPNYLVTPIGGTLSIGPRSASVKANDKERPYNTDNPALDVAVTGTVNGDVLSYTVTTAATKTTDVGEYPIVVTLTPGANPNYTIQATNGTLKIVKATQQIIFPAIGPKNYGDVFTVSASASSGLAVAFAASGGCSVAGAVVTVNSVATCTVTASQAGNGNYHPAVNVPQSFNATYTWSGVLQPINQDGSSIFKLGSTIPVKFKLTGASASITNLAARIWVAKVSDGVAGSEFEALTNANADAGNQFRYDPSGQLYIYNWGTKLAGGGLAASEGTWQIRIDLLDGAVHTVIVTLKR